MKIKFLIINTICLAILLPSFVLATPPQLPHIFYGSVLTDGSPTPVGTIIIAKVGGVEKGRITVNTTGQYGGSGPLDNKLLVQGNLSSTDAVIFYIGSTPANQSVFFSSGVIRHLDLTFTSTSSGGGGGGGGGSYINNNPGSIKKDINGDGKTNQLDVALLRLSWGKTGLGLASDLNGDGKIDRFDFALLMSNWSI